MVFNYSQVSISENWRIYQKIDDQKIFGLKQKKNEEEDSNSKKVIKKKIYISLVGQRFAPDNIQFLVK